MLKKVITIILCLLMLPACKTEEASMPEEFTGEAMAFENGEPWEGTIIIKQFGDTEDKFRLKFESAYRPGSEVGYIYMSGLHTGFIVQDLMEHSRDEVDRPAVSYHTGGFDYLVDVYDLDTTAVSNFVQFTRYDPERLELEGRFQITFILNHTTLPQNNPAEVVRFTEGTFITKVEQGWFD